MPEEPVVPAEPLQIAKGSTEEVWEESFES